MDRNEGGGGGLMQKRRVKTDVRETTHTHTEGEKQRGKGGVVMRERERERERERGGGRGGGGVVTYSIVKNYRSIRSALPKKIISNCGREKYHNKRTYKLKYLQCLYAGTRSSILSLSLMYSCYNSIYSVCVYIHIPMMTVTPAHPTFF